MLDWFRPSAGDISRVASMFGCDFSSSDALRFLTCMETLDVQAAPGSGKTTLLVAKLALMAEQWPWHRRGICVLSHTNVARSVVEERLARHASGQRLLSYPHFIGTFQFFVHQFLALPFLRGSGLEIRFVDDNRFGKAALAMAGRDPVLRAFLRQRTDEREAIVGSLRYAGPELRLGWASKGQLSETAASFGRLKELKDRLTSEGCFRYDDMYAYALAAVRSIPELAAGLADRFPCVFIDEMQDTTEEQVGLIAQVFGGQTLVQRLGDMNQAIYSERSDTAPGQATFPATGAVDLCESRRFDAHVARAASRIAAVRQQSVASVRGETGTRHTLLLFDNTSITNVLGAFASLVASELGSEKAHEIIIKALCARRRGEGGGLPRHLGDYYPLFDGRICGGTDEGEDTLQRAAVAARNCLSSATHASGPTGLLMDAICRYLQSKQATCADGKRLTPSRLLDDLGNRDRAGAECFRRLLARLMLDSEFLDQENWPKATKDFLEGLATYLRARSASADAFFAWDPTLLPSAESSAGSLSLFVHRHAGREIRVHLQTIHGAKGETHDATLVLESQSHRAYDLEKCLPVLAGLLTAEDLKTRFKTADRMLRVLFVGMTRPRHLLCLAAHKDHVADNCVARLRENGWAIADLSSTMDESSSPVVGRARGTLLLAMDDRKCERNT